MFCNFKVSQYGTTPTKISLRHKRSTAGCHPCRNRRKKCDEQKPICGRCKRAPSIHCTWDAETTASKHKIDTNVEHRLSRSLQLRLRDYMPDNLLCAQTETNRDRVELSLITFDRIHSMSYTDPSKSPLSLGLPLAVEKPALMLAYAACGASILSGTESSWNTVADAYHMQAVRLVSQAIDRIAHHLTWPQHEWLLATVNALHIFETLRKDGSGPNLLHIQAARRLCKEMGDEVPQTPFQRFVRQELVFQLAIMSTFNPSFESHYSHLEIRHLLRPLLGNEDTNPRVVADWKDSSPMGIAPIMFDYIFRLSYFRSRVPLVEWERVEVESIIEDLQAWNVPFLFKDNSNPDGNLPELVLTNARLYHLACLILAYKILNRNLTADDEFIRQQTKTGIQLLDSIGQNLRNSTCLIWPIAIIGISTVSIEERESCLRPMRFLLSNCSIGSVQAVLDLLQTAWTPRSGTNAGCWGLDVLFRDELLEPIMF